MEFSDLDLSDILLSAIDTAGYTTPTPIQAKAIPLVREGSDVLGCAQTGTGKTAAFALPIIERLMSAESHKGRRPVRALVLTPTRELAAQVADSFTTYAEGSHIRTVMIFGGVRQEGQVKDLKRGADVVVATPGRLLDLMGQGLLSIDKVEVFVLDEADRMLDMGFIPDIRKIVRSLPRQRQTLFFSATLPYDIKRLAKDILHDPVPVTVDPPSSTVEAITQKVYFVEQSAKNDLLLHLLEDDSFERVLVFTRTKYGADKLERRLKRSGIKATAIHGNKPQKSRTRTLESFKEGEVPVLVATDIAARGLDVDDITHVINLDLPEEAEVYVHRIGRTGRAGHEGVAISFCSLTERGHLQAIEKLTGEKLEVITDNPFASPLPPPGTAPSLGGRRSRRGKGRRYIPM